MYDFLHIIEQLQFFCQTLMNVGILAHALVIKHARTWLVHISAKNQFQVCYTGNIYTFVPKIGLAKKQNI